MSLEPRASNVGPTLMSASRLFVPSLRSHVLGKNQIAELRCGMVTRKQTMLPLAIVSRESIVWSPQMKRGDLNANHDTPRTSDCDLAPEMRRHAQMQGNK
jgi:hypothetical protein